MKEFGIVTLKWGLLVVLHSINSFTLAFTDQESAIINKCTDFEMNTQIQNNFSNVITNFMEHGNTEFRLSQQGVEMDCDDIKTVSLERHPSDTLIKPSSNETLFHTKFPILSPSGSNPRGYKLRGKIYDHFTKDGLFMTNSTYYDKNNYCVSNFSDSSITVRFCESECSPAGNRKGVSCIRIPKCCGLGQELVYWNFVCQSSQKENWTPSIYSNPHKTLTGKALEKIQLKYSIPLLKCKSWEHWPLSEVMRPRKKNMEPDPKLNWRLLKSGSIVYLATERKWKPLPKGDFCIDGFANWGLGGDGHYSGLEKDQVILLCPSDDLLVTQNYQKVVAYMYASFLFISSIFLLLTAIVHIALVDKLPVHGLTVLSHSTSMFLMYIFLSMAYFTTAKSIENDEDNIAKRGSFLCTMIGVCAHFFVISTFSWLTVMNFDLWWTFRIIKPMGRITKRMNRFRMYSTFGWGVPIIIISVFVGLDFTYRDIESEVIVPDYGVNNCFVACHARRIYIYYFLAILISINIVFIVSTCITFIRFQKNNKGLSSKKTTNSFKLFAKLFLIMGCAWCFELYSWIQDSCNSKASWHVIMLDFIMLFQAAGNFVIFCCNERTISQLEEKYPHYKKALKPIKRMLCLKTANSSGDGYDLGAQASGSTLRKMSTTISQSLQTDQTS